MERNFRAAIFTWFVRRTYPKLGDISIGERRTFTHMFGYKVVTERVDDTVYKFTIHHRKKINGTVRWYYESYGLCTRENEKGYDISVTVGHHDLCMLQFLRSGNYPASFGNQR